MVRQPAFPADPGPEEAQGTAAAALPGSTPRQLRLSNPPLVVQIDARNGTMLGRAMSCPIAAHPSVSNYISSNHARVWLEPTDPSKAYIMDCGSANGTWVNGERLTPWTQRPLNAGDTIRLASENPVTLEALP